MRLKVQQVFPSRRPFPQARMEVSTLQRDLPRSRAGLPFRSHSNLRRMPSGNRQSRGFPRELQPFLASLARTVSRIRNRRRFLYPHPPRSRKAGYAAPGYYPHAGSPQATGNCKPLPAYLSLHGGRVDARMPLRIAPSSLTSSLDPQLGVSSQGQKLHRCAL